MSTETTTTATKLNPVRVIVIIALVLAAFFGAYKFAAALSAPKAQPAAANAAAGAVAATGQTGQPGQAAAGQGAAGQGDPSAAGTPACACCGTSQPTENGVSGTQTEGAAVVAGDVQTIDVDLSTGVYNPNVIKLKAGVPVEITFGQSSGCTGQVMSKELGFFEDLTQGPKTVKVPALEKGEYAFSCGMEMVFGKIVVE